MVWIKVDEDLVKFFLGNYDTPEKLEGLVDRLTEEEDRAARRAYDLKVHKVAAKEALTIKKSEVRNGSID